MEHVTVYLFMSLITSHFGHIVGQYEIIINATVMLSQHLFHHHCDKFALLIILIFITFCYYTPESKNHTLFH